MQSRYTTVRLGLLHLNIEGSLCHTVYCGPSAKAEGLAFAQGSVIRLKGRGLWTVG